MSAGRATAIDVSSHALVAGIVTATDDGESVTKLVRAAREYIDAGAGVLELRARTLGPALAALRSQSEIPLAVCSDDPTEVRAAVDAGASVVRVTAPPTDGMRAVVSASGATVVVTVSPASSCDAAVADALRSIPKALAGGDPVAWCGGDDAAALAWAVALGARIAYAPDVPTAVRVTRTLAAIEDAA